MNQRTNSLQAALSGAATAGVEKPVKPAGKKRTSAGQGRAVKATQASKPVRAAAKKVEEKPTGGRYRDTTVMVGGHFPPSVLRQLRMIAAEEDTTNQALIGEALDLLFTRKGKGKIDDLAVG